MRFFIITLNIATVAAEGRLDYNEKFVNTDSPAIDLRNVSKIYRKRIHALRDVSLRVNRGEIFGLLGPNGAGKSTLVKIMMTVVKPTAAAGMILGKPVGHKPTLAKVGYLPENHRFPRYLTGKQAIEFFASLSGAASLGRRGKADELLETVGMSQWGDTKVSQYSKGMLQRVGIAAAMAADPDLIVLDEPTDGVDPFGRRDIRDLLLRMRTEGKTVFINSHLLSELEMVCDRIAVLVKGQVAVQGTMHELTSRRRFYLFELLESPDLPAKLVSALPGAFPGGVNGSINGGICRGEWKSVRGATWCEFDGSTLRVGVSEPTEAQEILDSIRRAGLILKRMTPVRPTLEELFIEAVGEGGKP